MKKFIKNTANSIRTKAIRLAATRRSGEGYIDTAVKILIAVVLGALLLAGLYQSCMGNGASQSGPISAVCARRTTPSSLTSMT